jgi:hypothetical protein
MTEEEYVKQANEHALHGPVRPMIIFLEWTGAAAFILGLIVTFSLDGKIGLSMIVAGIFLEVVSLHLWQQQRTNFLLGQLG